jgi:hypothetical protein
MPHYRETINIQHEDDIADDLRVAYVTNDRNPLLARNRLNESVLSAMKSRNRDQQGDEQANDEAQVTPGNGAFQDNGTPAAQDRVHCKNATAATPEDRGQDRIRFVSILTG